VVVRKLLAVLIVVLWAPSVARADPPVVKDQWATVNLCNTVKRPDAIGIRASMPGVPKGARLLMRFRVQFKADKGWQDVKGADSGWRRVGTGHGVPVESGWSFSFAHPTSPVTLRGMVKLRWRRAERTPLRQVELTTEAGHRSSAGADPADYSAETCALGS
jgi:hypothetical protein